MSRDIRPPGVVQRGAVGRRIGYLLAALVNVVLLWLTTAWPGWWAVPFLTEETREVIALVVASLIVGVVVNLVDFALDLAWVRSLGEIVTSAIALAVLVRFWEVFPFDFGGSDAVWALLTRIVIVVAVVGCGLSIIVQIAMLIRSGFRATSVPRPGPYRPR